MTTLLPRTRRHGPRLPKILSTACLSALIVAAQAADPKAPAAASAPDEAPSLMPVAASTNAMVNLVNLLVQQGVVKKEQGDALIAQAETEAANAKAAQERAASVAGPVSSCPPVDAVPYSTRGGDGAIRVTYVPESVRRQLREDIKQDVMKEQLAQGWALPEQVAPWTKAIRISGDVRARYEGDFLPSGNDALGYPNFNAINTGSPYNASSSNTKYPPIYNVDQDRERMRIRARVALDANLGEGFSAGIRLATGNDSSPISTNQTLGSNGLGAKYAAWIDRAFIRYDLQGFEDTKASFMVGRFDNPFFSTDLIWDDDLGFDGVVAHVSQRLGRFTPWLTLGAFPVYNTDFNFSTNEAAKYESKDKWLIGAQLGTDITITKDLTTRIGVAFYDFLDIQGELSAPIYYTDEDGNTDITRPSFAQKGNTYMELRNNAYYTDPTSAYYGENYQYYGLATPFRELVYTQKIDYSRFDPFHMSLEGEFVKNVAYDENRINYYGAQNNLGDNSTKVDGGDTGWLLKFTVGMPAIEQRWDWQAFAGYRYLETDAVVDAFADSDFGLGGTNLKGFFVGGKLGLSKNVWAGVRWMSANNVSGSPLASDVIQVDLSAKF
ncbi:MAG: putative porin [Chthoniobacteraceae bacterium]